MSDDIPNTGCCKPFDPAPWDGQEITWENKLFVKDHVICFMHIPLNMKSKIMKNMKLIEKAGYNEVPTFVMDECGSLFGTTIFIDVEKEIPGAKMTSISDTFMTKVFEGHYKNAGKWIKEMKEYVKNSGKDMKRLLFGYTACPKCAKVYGKNYVVLFAQI